MTRKQVIAALGEIMRDMHAKVAYFGKVCERKDCRMFCYEELHVCKGKKLMTFVTEVFPNVDDELEHGMRGLEYIPGDVLATIYNRLNSDKTSEFH